jgi:DNA-binding transcriptional MerR regulator
MRRGCRAASAPQPRAAASAASASASARCNCTTSRKLASARKFGAVLADVGVGAGALGGGAQAVAVGQPGLDQRRVPPVVAAGGGQRQLARCTGVPTRTVRFWSDAGLVPPASRSASGYRLYDAAAVARLDLIRTLRELGLGLDVVAAVLSRASTLSDVAATHVTALDAEIRTLRLRRAVLSTVASRGSTMKEAQLMHKLATLSAGERQQIVDDFVAEVFQGVDPGSPAMGLARGMRQMPAELPDDPAPEQVDAWIELGELVADESFRRRARAMAVAGAQTGTQAGVQTGTQNSANPDYQLVQEHAGRALAGGQDQSLYPLVTRTQRYRNLGSPY